MYPLAFDGHHRLFAAYIAGATAVRVLPVWYENLKTIRAFIDKDPTRLSSIWEGVYDFTKRLESASSEKAVG